VTPTSPATADTGELLSIGDLAAESGISPDTLRVWERRYGKPAPVRLPSGHRRYPRRQVRWLRRVAEALSRGMRPGVIVPIREAELDALLDAAHAATDPCAAARRELEGLVRLVGSGRAADLARRLRRAARALGPRRFVEERAAPLLEAVGRGWADGTLEIRHEHLATEAVEGVLRGLHAAAPPRPGAPVVLLATLEGETHTLGTRLAAVVVAAAGADARVLGTAAPVAEVAATARESGARAVGVSIPLGSGGVETDRRLAALRDLLAPGVELLAGGRGARGPRRGPRGVRFPGSLEALDAWARALVADAPGGAGAP
jgi:DNA-binding transcriptional MerR regulator/methylmalonyl-CoA mutase cobalamin-binding subunit